MPLSLLFACTSLYHLQDPVPHENVAEVDSFAHALRHDHACAVPRAFTCTNTNTKYSATACSSIGTSGQANFPRCCLSVPGQGKRRRGFA